MVRFEFKCGCSFNKLDFDNINLDCPATWDLIGTGFTRGIFQLEGSLGKTWAKKLKPRSILELSDVISLIRPGCLEAQFRENPDKPGEMWSITETYKKVKTEGVEPEYLDDCLIPIFEPTYSVLIYQEQIMKICAVFAGFDLQKADIMRRAVGKKKQKLMKSLKEEFIEGGIKNGHSKELGETIFGWITEFSAYGFNLSHGISYALISYQTAYAKRHFPLEYFKAKLTYSDDKQDSNDEIKAMVHEAKLFNIKVQPPNLKLLNTDFSILDSNTIAFGLAHIKGIGASSIRSLKRIAKFDEPDELLINSFTKGSKVKRNVMEALIKSGALDYLGDRNDLLGRYRVLSKMTARERQILSEDFLDGSTGIISGIKQFMESNKKGRKLTKPRKIKISNFLDEIAKDSGGNKKLRYIGYEKHYLNIPLSGTEVEIYNNPAVDIKCRDVHRLRPGAGGVLGVVIESVKYKKDKRGGEMCFMVVSDDTYILDCVVFSSTFKYYSWIIEEGKPVLIQGAKDKKRDSFIVRKISNL